MCRNIKILSHFEPPATGDEVHASVLQFVRKLSGCNRPSKVNAFPFDWAVDKVADAAREQLAALVIAGPPRARSLIRFGEKT